MRIGASTVLLEKTGPEDLLSAIGSYKATICFTAPTAYRAMLPKLQGLRYLEPAQMRFGRRAPAEGHLRLLAGSHGPQAHGRHRRHGDAAYLHCGDRGRDPPRRHRQAGPRLRGEDRRRRGPDGAARQRSVASPCAGPTGCRYLADDRQGRYVQDGWNITGDTYLMDEDGYFWYQARSDDMIVSSGYNIAGPEVEAALLTHPAVAECGVVAAPDAGARHDREGVRGAAARTIGPAHDLTKTSPGARQGGDRALQIPPRDRVRGRAARGPRPASCSASSFAGSPRAWRQQERGA